jgi:hypothetical protein
MLIELDPNLHLLRVAIARCYAAMEGLRPIDNATWYTCSQVPKREGHREPRGWDALIES